jgi:hypothetical protein
MLDLFPPMIHGTLREHYLLLFGGAGAVALVVGSVAGWVGAYFGARRASRQALVEAGRDQAQLVEARFAALAQTLDTVAIEVERITEGQRYTARLLSERPLAGPPAVAKPRREAGSVTPH